MTRILLVLLIASNAIWAYVRATRSAPPPRHAVRDAPREVDLRGRVEKARTELRAAEERQTTLRTKWAEYERRSDVRNAAWKQRAAWGERLRGHDRADALAARAEVCAGLTSGDPVQVLAALQAAWSVAQFDAVRRREEAKDVLGAEPGGPEPESLRLLVLPFLDAPDAGVRSAAASALQRVGAEPEDLPRVLPLALADEPRVRATAPLLLRQTAGIPVPERVKETVLRLLDDESASVVDNTLAAWGTTDLGPEYLDKVIALVNRPDTRQGAVSRVLARLDEKPDRVIDVLLDPVLVEDPSAGRSVREALRRGVPDRQHDRIADFFLRFLQLRDNPYVQIQFLEVLEQYGRPRDLAVLEAWAAQVELTPFVRKRLERTLAAIRRRQ